MKKIDLKIILLLSIIVLQVSLLTSCMISEERQRQLEIEATQEGQVAREYEEMQLEKDLVEHEKICEDTECTYEDCKNNNNKECTEKCGECNCCKCNES